MTSTATHVTTRLFRAEDEAAVLELLRASLGGGPAGERSAAFFRWKHKENPFGGSFLLLAEDRDRIVGLRAFMRWRFRTGARELAAVRAVDTATHPDYQGRGIFRTLTLEALERLRGEVDLVFNTPNDQSLPGYLKMGWRTVGRVPVHVLPAHPLRIIRGWRGDEPRSGGRVRASAASDALGDSELQTLLGREPQERLHTGRTPAYLRWRYADAPLLDYRAIVERDVVGSLVGLAVFRVRPRGGLREATVSELLVRENDASVGRRLLRSVARASAADHLAMLFPSGSVQRAGARRAGAIRVPGGMTLVCNPLRSGVEPDPIALTSWALSAGDLEVF